MICFLTSSTTVPGTFVMNPANRFIDELRARFPCPCDALFVCSDPDNPEKADMYADALRGSFEDAGFAFRAFDVLDGRTEPSAAILVAGSNLIILAGGHVPTQNRFFSRIGLKDLLRGFDGIVIGISAGSMNSAESVYAQPELEGEAVDLSYRRFLTGLGLTDVSLLPHYQAVKDDVLDGLRVFEDVTYPDSFGRTFYAIPDGSYLLVESGRRILVGEAYRIRDGVCVRISGDGETLLLDDPS